MPFVRQRPFTFTTDKIEAMAPRVMGVYGLFKGDTCVYVGRGDIRARLLDHVNGDNPCITGQAPTHYVEEVTASHGPRERALISELNPVCNQAG